MIAVLGERVFTAADQQWFAAQSRDHNPIHVDPVAARRLISGRQVVHGMHTVIQALEFAAELLGPRDAPLALQCNFVHPVNVGDRVQFVRGPDWQGRPRLSARVEGVSAADIVLGAAVPAATPMSGELRPLGALATPLDEPPEALLGAPIELAPWTDALAAHYPRTEARLGSAGLGDLARLSFLVGMVCPGLHSVFQSLQLRAMPADTPAPLRMQVLRYDERYRLFFVAFEGAAVQGELRALRRPPPLAQPTATELARHVAADRWAGRHALVVGGSRGLGETMAKLLAAAGAEVTITYARGADDAQAVAADIRSLGRGQCHVAALDLSQPFAGPADLAPAAFDAAFYFASPRIHAKRAAVFSRAAFDELSGFYVDRFHELCLWLEGAGKPVQVYLPSSTFIDERPAGMTEYAMAKAAAELLADDLNRGLRHVRIVHTRLPRLATDQTALVPQLALADNVRALLGVLDAVDAAER